MLATTISMLQLGMGGMPQRYSAYLDVFQPLHQRIGTTAAVTTAGLFLVLLAIGLPRLRKRISGSRA